MSHFMAFLLLRLLLGSRRKVNFDNRITFRCCPASRAELRDHLRSCIPNSATKRLGSYMERHKDQTVKAFSEPLNPQGAPQTPKNSLCFRYMIKSYKPQSHADTSRSRMSKALHCNAGSGFSNSTIWTVFAPRTTQTKSTHLVPCSVSLSIDRHRHQPTTIIYPPAKTNGSPEESDQSSRAREIAWK
jgi:hypothetical protein